MTGVREPEYLFTHGAEEHRRLVRQSAVLDPLTRELFGAAGLEPGARVLDLGSGAGNVSLLAAELVGPTGSVLGIDANPDTVRMAGAHADELGVENVEFRVGDVRTLDGVGDDFDAVVGRAVLMYLADPAAAVRAAAERIRPGGLLCLHEGDFDYTWAEPYPPLWTELHGLARETMARAGVEMAMGPRLHATYRAAGLPPPHLHVATSAWGGDDVPDYGWADAILGMLPVMERLGITSADRLRADTLRERMRAELRDVDGLMIVPLMFGAWLRLPDAGTSRR